MRHPLSKFVLLSSLLTTAAFAQVPDGSIIVSASAFPRVPGPGGLFLVDARVPGPPTIVQNLPADMVNANPTAPGGTNAVAVRDSDGLVFAGTTSSLAGTPVSLHEILILGNSATTLTSVPLGTVDSVVPVTGGVSAIVCLPDGDVIFSVFGLTNAPPMNGALLGRYTPGSTTVTPLPMTFNEPVTSGLALDPTGTTLYVQTGVFTGPQSTIYSVPVTGGAPTQIATGMGGPGLDTLSGGTLVTGAFADLVFIDPGTGTVVPIATIASNINGVAVERATDTPLAVLNGFSSHGVYWVDSSGTPQLLTSGLTGIGTDIAVRNNPRAFGTSTPGSAVFSIGATPNPGGLPRVGNTGFSCVVSASNNDASGAMLFGTAPFNGQVLGVDLWVTPILSFPIAASGQVPLPIQSTTSVGLTVYLQSLHLDAGAPNSIAASNGFLLTVMP